MLQKNITEPMQSELKNLETSIIRLVTMSNSILMTTATERLTTTSFPAVDMSPIIHGALAGVADAREQKHMKITLDQRLTAPLMVHGESDKLELALTNLLSNAIKYSPEQGSIEVVVVSSSEKNAITPESLIPKKFDQSHASTHDQKKLVRHVVIEIRDHGMGIPKNEIGHIFDGFYRANNAKQSGARGSGFGLYMTKKIVEFYGGMLECTSELGRGTTFTLTLVAA
jgi:two-component system phosphate regulon sensor histidine kinase PhoR